VKKARISQQQIARDLGVSQTLVSMALNGRKNSVSEQSYREIWEYARRSGYRPKGMAPELLAANGKASSIGFVMRSGAKLYSQSPFFGHVQHGLHEYLAAQGIALVLLGMENDLDAGKLRELYANAGSLGGIIVMGEVERPFLRALKQIEPRIVSVSAQYSGLCHSVLSNEEQAADQIVSHLVDLGHRKFGWLGGNEGMQRAQSRFDAVASALRVRDLHLDPKFCRWVKHSDRQDGRLAAELMLKAAPLDHQPTAWICFNGTMARGATNLLLQEGIRIPADISVATFDRTRILKEEAPTLTGANADPEEIGRVAGELLVENNQVGKGRYADIILDSKLSVGESTGKVATARRSKAQ